MPSKYQIRFVESSYLGENSPATTDSSSSSPNPNPNPTTVTITTTPRSNSKLGCKECKARRVKCDETYPTCLRCQRRGTLCRAPQRPSKWQVESPWLNNALVMDPFSGPAKIDKRALQHWMESTSLMMTMDSEVNVLALPILRYLPTSPQLVHAVQSFSIGHENYFAPGKIDNCLQERGKAMRLIRREFEQGKGVSIPTLLSIFLIGMSSPWLEPRPVEYGKEHFMAAKTLLELMMPYERFRDDPLYQYTFGSYIYWEMCCSFVAKPGELIPLDSEATEDSIRRLRGVFHPMTGYATDLYHVISTVSRYCRRVLDFGEHNRTLEADFEAELLAWEPSNTDERFYRYSYAVRNYALVLLYRVCGRLTQHGWDDPKNPSDDTNQVIKWYALDSLDALFNVPTTEGTAGPFNYQATPLAVVSAELTSDEAEMREKVVRQFQGLCSSTRLPIYFQVVDALEKAWDVMDKEGRVAWPELFTREKWLPPLA